MAGEEKKLRGYDYSGNPIYEAASPAMPSREELEEQLLHDLDCILMFENGKGYYEFADGEYFEIGNDEEPDISHLVKLNEKGDVISSRPFDIMAS